MIETPVSPDQTVIFSAALNAFAAVSPRGGQMNLYTFDVDPLDEDSHLSGMDEDDALDEVRSYDYDCSVYDGRLYVSECETSVELCRMVLELSAREEENRRRAREGEAPVAPGGGYEEITFGDLIARRERIICGR